MSLLQNLRGTLCCAFFLYFTLLSPHSQGVPKVFFQESMLLACYKFISWFVSFLCISLTSPIYIQTSPVREFKCFRGLSHMTHMGERLPEPDHLELAPWGSAGGCQVHQKGSTFSTIAFLNCHPYGGPAFSWPPWLTIQSTLPWHYSSLWLGPLPSIPICCFYPPPCPSVVCFSVTSLSFFQFCGKWFVHEINHLCSASFSVKQV